MADISSSAALRKPLLFISHRHEDKAIADRVSSFIVNNTANRVAVYQSSSVTAESPRPGEPLTEELKKILWQTDVFLWLYTQPNTDWSWCSCEYGIALDDHPPDALPIVFQFCDKFPGMFADRVRIDVRKRDDIEKFTRDLFTAPDFFRGHPGPVTAFSPESERVKRAADELYASLHDVWPLTDEPEPEAWPPYPYMQLAIDLKHVPRLKEASPDERVRVTRDILENEAVVTHGDRESGRLFGRRTAVTDVPFKDLLARWQQDFPDSKTEWVNAISSQICSAALGEFPTLVWQLMRAIDKQDGTWYGPALIQVQESTRRQALTLDICFLKFALGPDDRAVVGVPKV